ncbi:SIMPL domain-containing protein [Flavobacterium chungangense]|uniref:SIMPL domain-containing protein n=1 Tax=Flavobacterium chungangense TaxID=554283 RepID=A0A6V6Z821_9FLAO|nr:SIMPL domain-containing protein [Flavobacterium chungangense]CAD0007937.1 hypothetical protein FLACHUCJ7_03532 [Flavobacterium chungangense]
MKKSLLALFALLTINSFSQTKNSIDKPFIEVSGQADTLVAPNKIWISIFLTEKDSKGKKSIEDLEKEMILKLQNIGIDIEKNLSINDMSSNLKYHFIKQNDIFKSKSYFVLVKNASDASKVFINLEKIDISNVRIEKIENTDEKTIRLLLNKNAILNAKQTAESFTKPLNQKVGNIFQMSNLNEIPNQLSTNESRIYGNSNENMPQEFNIEFEKIKISSTVQVRFLIE